MLDPSIIMSGQPINVLGAMEAGRAAAESQIGLNRQNALASLYKTQGPQIMAGDTNALNALARFDPNAAMGVQGAQLGLQGQRQDLAFNAEKMQMARDEAKANAARAIQERADKLTAEQAAAEADKVEKGVAAAMAAKTPEQWDAMAQQFGVPDLVGQFANREAIAGSYMGVADALKEFTPKAISPNERFKVAGSTLFDLGAEGGPAPVGQGAMPEETVMGPDGKPLIIRGGPGTTAKFTEAQSKDVVFATRADGALATLDPVAGALTNLGDRALDYDPTGLVRGAAQSDTYQLARQAGDEFLQAILRKDTGAAITEPEQNLYGKTYLPQPGDNAAVLDQKKASRRRAVEAIRGGMNQAQIEAMAKADAQTLAALGKGSTPAQNPSSPGPTDLSPDVQSWYEKYKSAP